MADPFTDAMILAMEMGEVAEATAPLLGRAIATAATALERAGPAVVAAGVGLVSYAAKRPFGVFSGPETPGKAGKKLRRLIHEGFEPKRLFKDLGNSLFPAHKRPHRETLPSDMPGRAGKRPGRADKRTTKRRIAKSGPTGKRKRTTTKKKVKKVKKKSGVKKNVTVAYETHGLIQRDNVSYFGFQSTGGLDQLFEIACEGVMRSLLRKFRIQVRTPDEVLGITQSVPAVDKFIITSRRRDYSDGTDDGQVNDTIDLNAATYKSVVLSFATAMRTRAEAGYFPFYMRAYNNAGTADANEVMRDVKFGQARLTLAAAIKIKMRNITPNDGDGTDRFALDTNPLQGRLYKFAGDVPRVREAVYETFVTDYAKFSDRQGVNGVMFGPQRNASGDHTGAPDAAANIMGDGKILSSPPANGKAIWSNCVSSHPIVMQPGGAAMHNLKFTFNGTFVKFLQKYNVNQFTLPNIGTCHWLGLEQTYKQKKKAASGAETVDGHDHIVVEYDLDTKLSSGCAFAAAERAPREVVTVAAFNSAPV